MSIAAKLANQLQGAVESFFPDWSHRRQRAKWERQWANPEYNPFWKTEEPQKELIEAINSGWFPKGQLVIDVGCGKGQVSRWLAEQGFRYWASITVPLRSKIVAAFPPTKGKRSNSKSPIFAIKIFVFLPPRASSIADVSIASRTISGRPMRAISPVPPLQEDIFSFFAVLFSILVSKTTGVHVANRN